MKRVFELALTLGAVASIAALCCNTPAALADNRDGLKGRGDIGCTGTVGGGATVTTVEGNVIVRGHSTCTLAFVDIKGDVEVEQGGSLLIEAYDEPSTIGGDVRADHCGSVLLEGNVQVAGDLQIEQCNGTATNGFTGPGIVINGNFTCRDNAGACEAWLGQIAGDAQIANNRSSSAVSDVSLNAIGGNLQCDQNSGASRHDRESDRFSGAVTHEHGPNWVTGRAQGQCAEALGFVAIGTSIVAPHTPPSLGTACGALASLPTSAFPVPNTVITSATDVAASGSLPARCIVDGYVNRHVSPVDNCTYQDGFEVQLPLLANWNSRFMFQGGGGTEGSVPVATGSNSGSAGANFGINAGYAVASQDGGHENSLLTACGKTSLEFYLDPMATIDNGYQSIDVATLTAKYLIAAYYGNGPGHSYWVGCSEGGRQGMTMSQTFPQYYDGIVAGDPVYDVEVTNLAEIWSMQQILNVYKTANPPLPPITEISEPPPQAPEPIVYPAFPVADQSLFETALLQACDALDGVADGVIDNPPACQAKFDPALATYTAGGTTFPLECTGAKNATCLSRDQIEAVKNINQGARNSAGQAIAAPAGTVAKDHTENIVQGYAYDGGYMTTVGIPARNIGSATRPPGNEGQVAQLPYALLTPADPSFDPLAFNFDSDIDMLRVSTPKIAYSTSLDISQFIRYGHKIIWYHGLTDPGPSAVGTINYYNGMAKQHGGLEAAQKFSRLYPIPNLDHCTGGATTDQFDMLTPLAEWVEHGTQPGPIPAKGITFDAATYQVGFVSGPPDNAPTTRNRPLCPYPQEARFTGSVALVQGVPVATNPADLANVSNYQCIMPSPPYLQ
jgi:hypothetical protein